MGRAKSFLPPLLLCLSVSFALRIYALDRNSYWIDEMFSIHAAKFHKWSALFWDNTPFLYHLFLKGWIFLFGDREVATRGLSVVFSVGTTGVLSFLGLALFGPVGLFLFGFLHALSSLSIQYAQETRMYAQLEFFTALHLLGSLGIKKANRKLYYLSGAGLVLTHYLGLVPLALQAVWLLIGRNNSREKKRIIGFIVLMIVVVSVSYGLTFSWPHILWQKMKFSLEPNSRWPIDLFWLLGFRSWFSIFALFVLLGVSGIDLWRAKLKWADAEITFFLAAFCPVLLFCTVSNIFERSMLLPRYLIFVLPYFVVWIGSVLHRHLIGAKSRRYLGVGFLLFLVGGSSFSIEENYRNRKAPWREVATEISKFPDSLILITKTTAIQTPYFTNANIVLERWKADLISKEEIESRLNKFKNIWIVDTYWDAQGYFERVEKILIAQKWHYESRTEAAEFSEPLFVIHITKQ